MARLTLVRQGHVGHEDLRFGIQQPIEQFLLAVVEAAVTVAPPESRLRRTASITALLVTASAVS